MTYGTPKTCPVPPDHPQNPLGPYGRSKYAAEKILLATESIRATIFRPRLITGPGRLGILGKLFTLIKAGLPVPMIGSGTNRYQMVGVGIAPAPPFWQWRLVALPGRDVLERIQAKGRLWQPIVPVFFSKERVRNILVCGPNKFLLCEFLRHSLSDGG